MKKIILTLPILITLIVALHHGAFAQQSPLLVTFNPNNVPLKTNEEKIIKVSLSSEQAISAFDLNFQTSGGLSITGFVNNLGFDNNFDPFKLKEVASEINNSGSRLAYILNAPASALPKRVDIFIKIRGQALSQGKITLNYNNSQVLSGNNSLLQISPNQSAVFDLNDRQSSPEFIDPATLPAPAYPENTARVNLKLKLYGYEPERFGVNSSVKIKAVAVIVGRIGEGKYETLPQSFELISNNDPGSESGAGSTFSGTIAFPNFKDGNKYSLMLKADKYLLRRICDAKPTESKAGGYRCQTPSLTIRSGEANSFDFSGMSLLPGDLGVSDGILNGYDLGIVRNNLGQNGKESIALADLNYDGVVDNKDFAIIEYVAANTGRRADQ